MNKIFNSVDRSSILWTRFSVIVSILVIFWGIFIWLRPEPIRQPPIVCPVYLLYPNGTPAIDFAILSAEGDTYYPDRRGVVLIPFQILNTTVSLRNLYNWEEKMTLILKKQHGIPTKIILPR